MCLPTKECDVSSDLLFILWFTVFFIALYKYMKPISKVYSRSPNQRHISRDEAIQRCL